MLWIVLSAFGGLVIGGMIGFMVAALCAAAKRGGGRIVDDDPRPWRCPVCEPDGEQKPANSEKRHECVCYSRR